MQRKSGFAPSLRALLPLLLLPALLLTAAPAQGQGTQIPPMMVFVRSVSLGDGSALPNGTPISAIAGFETLATIQWDITKDTREMLLEIPSPTGASNQVRFVTGGRTSPTVLDWESGYITVLDLHFSTQGAMFPNSSDAGSAATDATLAALLTQLGNGGMAGPVGPMGPTGPQGVAGPPGPQGPPGQGWEGPRGIPGENGADGIAGPAGPAGKDGIDGQDGPAGEPGAPGPAGKDAENGLATITFVTALLALGISGFLLWNHRGSISIPGIKRNSGGSS